MRGAALAEANKPPGARLRLKVLRKLLQTVSIHDAASARRSAYLAAMATVLGKTTHVSAACSWCTLMHCWAKQPRALLHRVAAGMRTAQSVCTRTAT